MIKVKDLNPGDIISFPSVGKSVPAKVLRVFSIPDTRPGQNRYMFFATANLSRPSLEEKPIGTDSQDIHYVLPADREFILDGG